MIQNNLSELFLNFFYGLAGIYYLQSVQFSNFSYIYGDFLC